MAYTNIDNPELYMQVKLYSGNGTTNNAQTLDGSENMRPDMIWFKRRSGSANHFLYDSVRGVTKSFVPNDTDSESTSGEQTTYLSSFDSDGFTLGDDVNNINASGQTYVAWCWKAGTSFSNDASSTGIGTVDSSGSVSNDSGFSIVSWVGPSWILVKNRDAVENWVSFHTNLGAGKNQKLNNTENFQQTSGSWNDTAPTSSVFTVGSFTNVNQSSTNMMAYVFSEVKGYSKFTQYQGTGNADGNFCFLGFRPSFVMIKSTGNAESWFMYDNKRPAHNVNKNLLNSNNADQEVTSGANQIDILSNGFKTRATNNGVNRSGDTFNVFAFAESPFVNSKGVPNNAR